MVNEFRCHDTQKRGRAETLFWEEVPRSSAISFSALLKEAIHMHLVVPHRAILRYYRCDTPYRAILCQGLSIPQNDDFTQAHLCDTAFCNISRDNCAIPHKNKHKRVLQYYRYNYRYKYRVSCDMKVSLLSTCSLASCDLRCRNRIGKILVSTSTVAVLFSKMAFTRQRIAMVDMVLQVFPAFPYLP